MVLYFLLLELGTVGLLGTIAYFHAHADLERAVLGRLEVAAALKADALVRWADTQKREFLLFAELAPIRDRMEEVLHDPAVLSSASRAVFSLAVIG